MHFHLGLLSECKTVACAGFRRNKGVSSAQVVSHQVATRCLEKGTQSGAGGDAEQSKHGEKHSASESEQEVSAPLCLLCTYGVGRGPRRGSKYCEKRWGFPWRSAIARFPPAESWPAQPFQDAGALQAPEKTQEQSMPQFPMASSPTERSEPTHPHPQASGEPLQQPGCHFSSPPRLAKACRAAGCSAGGHGFANRAASCGWGSDRSPCVHCGSLTSFIVTPTTGG